MKKAARKKVSKKMIEKSDQPAITIAKIKQAICKHTGLKWEVIADKKTRGGARKPALARHLFCYIIKKYHPHISFKQIGKYLNNRHHSTVLYSVDVISDYLAVHDPVVTQMLIKIHNSLNSQS